MDEQYELANRPRKQTAYQRWAVKTIRQFLGQPYRAHFRKQPSQVYELWYAISVYRLKNRCTLPLGACLDWCDEQSDGYLKYYEDHNLTYYAPWRSKGAFLVFKIKPGPMTEESNARAVRPNR